MCFVPLRAFAISRSGGSGCGGGPPQTFSSGGEFPRRPGSGRLNSASDWLIGGQWVRLSLRSAAWDRFLVGPDELFTGKAGGHHDPSSGYTRVTSDQLNPGDLGGLAHHNLAAGALARAGGSWMAGRLSVSAAVVAAHGVDVRYGSVQAGLVLAPLAL